MGTKMSTRTRRVRIGRAAAAVAAVAASGLFVSAEPVSAQPTGGASTMSTTCNVTGDLANTYYGIYCDSGWPWEDFGYMAWVRCTDDVTYYGIARSSYWHTGWSTAKCDNGTIVKKGVDYWDW